MAGHDVISGLAGHDTLNGGSGNDSITGGAGNDNIAGGTGYDIAYYSGFSYDYTAREAGGIITVADKNVGDGDDAIDKLTGIEALQFTNGLADWAKHAFKGTTADDQITALDDTAWAIDGGAGHDVLKGSIGADMIIGSAGNDTIYGNAGDDRLVGGDGTDWLYGGTGADTFVIDASAYNGRDVIKDFALAEGDKLDLSRILEGYDAVTSAITDFVKIMDNGTDTYLYLDKNGNTDGHAYTSVAVLRAVTGLSDEDALLASGNLVVS